MTSGYTASSTSTSARGDVPPRLDLATGVVVEAVPLEQLGAEMLEVAVPPGSRLAGVEIDQDDPAVDRSADALLARITTQLGLKAAGHGLHQGQTGLTPHLASIGG